MTEVERITDLNRISFPKLGIDFHIDPTAFSIGSLTIQWYGIIIVVGLLLAVIYCVPRMKRFGIDSDKAIDAVIGGVIGGIIGARLYYVLFRWDQYKDNLLEIFNTRNGGLAIYGGLIGAVIVGLVICKIKDIRMLPMLDIVVIGFLLGQGIGRWGNLVNQEAFGRNTDSLFGMTGGRIQNAIINSSSYFDGALAQKGIELSERYPVHPCFLYESAWCLLGFLLLSLYARRRKYDGQLLLMYLAWYGAERFIVEGLRTDSLMVGNIRISQALSALLVITSVILQIIMFFRVRRDPDRYKLYANTGEARLQLEESRRKKVVISPADSAVLDSNYDEIGILPDEDEEQISSIIDDAEDEAEELAGKAEDAAEAVKDKAEDAAETVKEKAEDAAETVKEKAEDAAETVKDKAEDAAETVKEKVEDAAETVKEKAEDAAETVKDKIEAAKDKAEDAGEVLTGVVEGVIEDAEDRVQEFAEDIGDDVKAVEEAAEDITDKVKDAAEAAVEKAEDIAEDAAETAGAVKEKAEEAAGEVIETAEEVKDKTEEIKDETEDKYEHLAEKHDEKLTGGSGKKNGKKKKHRR